MLHNPFKAGEIPSKLNQKGYIFLVAWFIIIAGILLRLTIYIQCDSMYMDEANVARNIFERSFVQLVNPLSYFQYAPPVFLWIVKLSTQLFGYSEYAYRLYPLATGIISLIIFWYILQYFKVTLSAVYVLALLAFGPIYVRYSVQTKQYVPDMMVALILLWAALKYNPGITSPKKLFFIWAFGGSLAIWSSMPSVFILGGIGLYYITEFFIWKDYKKTGVFVLCAVIWLAQFVVYYFTILKSQANSDYLQNFHKDYFFYYPSSMQIASNNFELLTVFLSTIGGHQALALILHSGCFFLGCVFLWRLRPSYLLLVLLPVIFMLVAACVRQYSLIPRLTLAVMPLLLIAISIGLDELLRVNYILFKAGIAVILLICVVNYNVLKNFVIPMQVEEVKQSLDYLVNKKIEGSQLYVEQLGVPAYVYYTGISPYKVRWATLRGAETLDWNTNFDSLAITFPSKAAMLYSWDEPWKVKVQQECIQHHAILVDSFAAKGTLAYIYSKK